MRLTPRERDVHDLVIQGLSNKEIARRLQIGSRTVEAHRASIYKKADVRNSTQLLYLSFLKLRNASVRTGAALTMEDRL